MTAPRFAFRHRRIRLTGPTDFADWLASCRKVSGSPPCPASDPQREPCRLPVGCGELTAVAGSRLRAGVREISTDDLFVDLLTTSLEPDEIVTSISVPALNGAGAAYESIQVRRDGALIATLAGDAVAHTDLAAPGGTHTYEVRGLQVGNQSAWVPCGTTVPVDAVVGLQCALSGSGRAGHGAGRGRRRAGELARL